MSDSAPAGGWERIPKPTSLDDNSKDDDDDLSRLNLRDLPATVLSIDGYEAGDDYHCERHNDHPPRDGRGLVYYYSSIRATVTKYFKTTSPLLIRNILLITFLLMLLLAAFNMQGGESNVTVKITYVDITTGEGANNYTSGQQNPHTIDMENATLTVDEEKLKVTDNITTSSPTDDATKSTPSTTETPSNKTTLGVPSQENATVTAVSETETAEPTSSSQSSVPTEKVSGVIQTTDTDGKEVAETTIINEQRCQTGEELLKTVSWNQQPGAFTCKPAPYAVTNSASCRVKSENFFTSSSTITPPQEYNAGGLNPCQQDPLPNGGCHENCTFGDLFPYLQSIGGSKDEMGPAALQWLKSVEADKAYVTRAHNHFKLNFTSGNLTYADDKMLSFDIYEEHLPVNAAAASPGGNGYRTHGGELGGSYYYVQVELTSCDGNGGDMNVVTSTCRVFDHFNGSYKAECPTAAASALFFELGSTIVQVSVTMILEYTHFRGWNPTIRQWGGQYMSDMPVNLAVMSSFPVLTLHRASTTNTTAPRPECTSEEAWNAGGFGGAWIDWKGGAMTYVPASSCNITNYDGAINDASMRNRLTQCINNTVNRMSMNGASHMRFSFDEIAERMGIRDKSLPLHHGDHNYLNGKLNYRSWSYFNDVRSGFSNDLARFMANHDVSQTPGLGSRDVYAVQTGAWNTAFCMAPADNLPRYDTTIRALISLRDETKSNATFVLMSSPPYPRDDFSARHLRRNPILQAFSEIEQIYAKRLHEKMQFLDFFGIGVIKANHKVCTNHFVCPENPSFTHGVVGKAVVDAFLNAVCGDTVDKVLEEM